MTALGVGGHDGDLRRRGRDDVRAGRRQPAGQLQRDGRRARRASPSRRARRARSPRRSTAARPGRAATCRRRTTSSTSRSRRRPTGSRWTTPAACSAPATAAPPGARSTSGRPRGRRRSTRRAPTTAVIARPDGPAPLHGLRRHVQHGHRLGEQVRSSPTSTPRAPTLVAYGSQDVWRSTDQGKTWSAVRKPGKYKKNKNGKQVNSKGVRSVDFLSANSGVRPRHRRTAVPHEQRREVVDGAPGDGQQHRLRHGVQLGGQGLPDRRPLRVHDGRVPAADDRLREDLDAGVRRLLADQSAGRRGRRRRNRLPPRRLVELPVHQVRRPHRRGLDADDHDEDEEVQEAAEDEHHRHRQAQSRRRAPTRSRSATSSRARRRGPRRP